jgi:2-polyprenyl-3-methyl-5-hydroxy-6-metoxy-1,4-benzoquinol methylase
MTTSRHPTLTDYLALWLLKLAKSKRTAFRSTQQQDYEAFYEGFFEEKDLEAYDRDRRMNIRRDTLNQYLAQHFPNKAKILDVGCGLGDVLNDIERQFNHELHGMDYAQSNVKVAQKRLEGKASIIQGNIYDLPYESDSFDLALCLEVLEHIEDDQRAIREIARVLKPGGVLIAAVPYTYYWPQYQTLLGHFRHYTRESFTARMKDNGFSEVVDYLPNYHNWHQAYTRRYTLARAQHVLFGGLLGQKSLYEFKWPWQTGPALDQLWKKLEPLRLRDAQLDYRKETTSTFLVAQK